MTTETFTDAEAVALLRAIVGYLEAYKEETPTTMTVYDLAGDLIESLPVEALERAGLTELTLSAAGLI